MPTYRDITLKECKIWSDIMFPVEIKKSSEVFTDGSFKSNINNVVINPDTKEYLAFHPDTYRFESNREFMMPVIDKILDIYPNVDFKAHAFDNRQFFLDVMVNSELYEITKNDTVCPMVSFTNSYDGSLKQSVSLSFYRQICSNGLKGFSKQYTLTARHIKSSGNIEVKRLYDDLESSASRLDTFRKMTERRLLPNEMEELVKKVEESNTLKFPKRNISNVIERANTEANHLGTPLNSWLAYNAFNWVLNHSDTRLFPHEKEKIDKRVLEFVETY